MDEEAKHYLRKFFEQPQEIRLLDEHGVTAEDFSPEIKANPWVPWATMLSVAPRRPGETDEEWAKRCAVITNIGEPEDER